ncbi:hypothetical protein LCGC14_2557590, partial [marine sediment metagenome]
LAAGGHITLGTGIDLLGSTTSDLGATGARLQKLWIGAIDVSGTSTLDTLAVTTMGPSTWPSFSAHRNGVNQSISSTVPTKIKFTIEDFDAGGDFVHDPDDSGGATESRFTPALAGYYLLTGSVGIKNSSGGSQVSVYIYKNGATYRKYIDFNTPTSGGLAQITAVVYSDGDDYFELWALCILSGTPVIDGDILHTNFMGSRIA